ncbi:MAG TPA: alpha/beta hydrolase [Acidimicrobiales bacterium]
MIVFVHGVPETAAIWDEVRAGLDGPTVALSLPGFGTPRPAGFGSTKDDYVGWLVGELEAIGEPVHLVGHDWGAGLVGRVAQAHGHLVASWAIDVANILHPDYVWHGIAQLWQDPVQGEAVMEAQAGTPVEDQAQGLTGLGLELDDARLLAGWSDAEMRTSILALYRSAVPNAHATWGPLHPTDAPGLVLHVDGDPFNDVALAGEVAKATGADQATLEGAGHFWPLQAPAAGVDALRRFWSTLSHPG